MIGVAVNITTDFADVTNCWTPLYNCVLEFLSLCASSNSKKSVARHERFCKKKLTNETTIEDVKKIIINTDSDNNSSENNNKLEKIKEPENKKKKKEKTINI